MLLKQSCYTQSIPTILNHGYLKSPSFTNCNPFFFVNVAQLFTGGTGYLEPPSSQKSCGFSFLFELAGVKVKLHMSQGGPRSRCLSQFL